ncbi:MAG: glycosyltransferase family 2 protein [Nitrososphaerales archaeon]
MTLDNLFSIVLARDAKMVPEKINELSRLGIPFVIICGEKFNHEAVVYRRPEGKWDAINYGASFIPKKTEVVILNDVDTKIKNFMPLITKEGNLDLAYCDVRVREGPQVNFYRILNPIRTKIHITSSGELMFIRKSLFDRITPIPPCLSEDSYLLFKTLQLGYSVKFANETYVTTERTKNSDQEVKYKERTTLGIYQALKFTRPTPWIIAFYKLLPLMMPLLTLTGKDGRAWSRGIRNAIRANVRHQYPSHF